MAYKFVLKGNEGARQDDKLFDLFETTFTIEDVRRKFFDETFALVRNKELGLWTYGYTTKRGDFTWCAHKPAGILWLQMNTPPEAIIICNT